MNKLPILLLIIFSISCKKEFDKPDTRQNIDEKINTAPKVFAGYNIKVTLPEDSVKLEATVTDAENNIAGYIWKKISGPVSYRLINGNSVHSKVFDLQEGVYEFELTVTDKGALTGKDTVSVTVEPPINTAPKVSAGKDTVVVLPLNTLQLSGSATDAQNNIESYLWKKISGPTSHTFENATSITTKVFDLKQGTYEFELTVTDKLGLKGSDTVAVYVIDSKIGSNEIIYKDLTWECPWGCYTELKNIPSYVIVTGLKAFVKNTISNQWIEVKQAVPNSNNYSEYYFDNNTLIIYTYDYDLVGGDIKIIF